MRLDFLNFWVQFSNQNPKKLKISRKLLGDYGNTIGPSFLVNFGQKGPDFEFGHFSTVKSPEFSICAKIDFFWSEWLQKRSECRLALKFLAETLIRPKRGRFWRFLAILVVFDHIWKWTNLPGSALAKSRFFSWIILYTFGTMPGRSGFHCVEAKIFRESAIFFRKFFT